MTRVTKNPEIRREELIDIAEELFATQGYDETPVSDIVKKAQVAQGTFYYYFKSKDEILDAIVDRIIYDIATFLKEQSQRKDINALQKVINSIQRFSQSNVEHEGLISYLHQEKNSLLHLKIEEKTQTVIVPIFAEVIQQGVDEGLFDAEYPEKVSLMIFSCWDKLFDARDFASVSLEGKKRLVTAGFSVIERILGTPKGSLAVPFVKIMEMHHGRQ
jgi:AcrR family transcriptional regulator